MNLTHVLAFHRVATAGGFTAGARMAGVSQPTLSAQVRALEVASGLALIERHGRGLRLTRDGLKLHAATGRLAVAIEEVEQALAEPRDELKGALRVSADSAVHVIPILAELKRRSKGFVFALRIDNSAAVIEHVLGNEADVGVMARRIDEPRLHAARIREDRLVLQVARGDPWAASGEAHLSDLAGRDLVVRERGSITREVIETRLGEAGVAPGQVFDVATREAVVEAVAAGFGTGIVFASEAGSDRRVRSIAISGADVSVAEYAICRAVRRRISVIARFFEVAREVAGQARWVG